jgi:hypothetical protein
MDEEERQIRIEDCILGPYVIIPQYLMSLVEEVGWLSLKEDKMDEEKKMRLYRKKPVDIEAVQFVGGKESAQLILDLVDGAVWHYNQDHISLPTLEGRMSASKGDWIIKGIEGEFYPCKPNIFKKTYELV